MLIDEGLPAIVAEAFRALRLTASAIGDDGAPPKGSPDDVNVAWCAANKAVLITNDYGRKDKTILNALAQHRVHAVFIRNDLRKESPHLLARALLCAEEAMQDRNDRAHGLIHHFLSPGGKLVDRKA